MPQLGDPPGNLTAARSVDMMRTGTSPDERYQYLESIGAAGYRRRLESAELAYRSGRRVLGEPSELDQIAALWRGPATNAVVVDVLDTEASGRARRPVRSRTVVNVYCRCGGEASVPPVDPYGEFVCASCWRVERDEQLDRDSHASLAARSAARDLPELVAAYDRPGGLGNPVRRSGR